MELLPRSGGPETKIRGREIDPAIAVLSGEGAHQEVTEVEVSRPISVWMEVPSLREEPVTDYYGLPVVKEPVWTWTVPLYFYVGGVAGGAGVLAAVLQAKKKAAGLIRRCRWLAFGGATLSAGLLTYDLGKPFRFLYMLRVFRPTSPMSVGSWGLAETGALAGAAVVLGEFEGAAGRAGRVATMTLATHGAFLAGYTGVLLCNSETPLWKHSRWTLPILFPASGMTAAAGLLDLLPLGDGEEKIVRSYGTAGKIAEIAAIKGLEAEADRAGVARPLHEGRSGFLWGSAKICLAAGIVISLLPGKSPKKRRIGGILTTAGSILLRYALMEAGKASANDPQATVRPQLRM